MAHVVLDRHGTDVHTPKGNQSVHSAAAILFWITLVVLAVLNMPKVLSSATIFFLHNLFLYSHSAGSERLMGGNISVRNPVPNQR